MPKAVHKAGFHPTAVFGTMAAAAGVGAALKLDARQLANALGIAGSMASGIIEYLADGSSTKRLHAGWAAQSGLRAALLARAGFTGPRTVFEGVHGLFNGFAHTREGDYGALLDGFGERWLTQTLAFKPYPCGTMVQPYIDCALRLRSRGIAPDDIAEMLCEVGEGTVHRLWEPLADKQRPPNGYAAKFATPYCIAAAFLAGSLGLDAFTDAAVADPRACARSPPRCATASIRPIPTRAPSPATSAPRCATAASSRSASRTCAAAPTSPSPAPSWRTSSPATPHRRLAEDAPRRRPGARPHPVRRRRRSHRPARLKPAEALSRSCPQLRNK